MAAREVVLPNGDRAKVRDEGLVILWTVLTLGIYVAVWYYKINREMRDFGRAHGDEKLAKTKPVLSVLATTVGGLVLIPAIVSWWRTTGRIRHMQRLCGVPLTEGWVIGILYVVGWFTLVTWPAIPPYVQSGLNKVWRLYPPAEGDEVELTTAPPSAPQAAPWPPSARSRRSRPRARRPTPASGWTADGWRSATRVVPGSERSRPGQVLGRRAVDGVHRSAEGGASRGASAARRVGALPGRDLESVR